MWETLRPDRAAAVRPVAWMAAFCGLATWATAGTFGVFGPETFIRESGPPVTVVRTFPASDTSASYQMRVRNGVEGRLRVNSAVITLNGRQIFGPSDFKPTVEVLERAVKLQASNQLTVQLRSRPGSALSVEVLGIDDTPPSIQAVADPPANAQGWNNSDVTVSFTCSDAGSGIAVCPGPVTLTAEGAGQVASGTAVDRAGNTATASVTVNLDETAPSLTSSVSPLPNAAGWNRTDVTVSFAGTDALSGIASVSPAVTLTMEGAGQSVPGAAVDNAGNAATATVLVNIDKTPPTVAFTSPPDGTIRRVPRVEVAGTAADANALAAVTVDGVDVGAAGLFTHEVTLADEGPRTITAAARDIADLSATASVSVVYRAPPVVEITSPADLSAIGSTPVTVSGTVDDPQATVFVGLERIPAVVTGNTFMAAGVPLREGGNVLTAVATDAQGDAGSDAITVVLDTTAPRVVIDSPARGSATTSPTLTVTGRVHDVAIGTVNAEQAQVSVNGRPAQVSHRTFVVDGVPLVPGINTLTAVATDAVGNADQHTATIVLETVPGIRIHAISGAGQTAAIGELLAEPLVVAVTDAGGNPVPGRTVVFRVSENNGIVSDGTQSASGLALTTDPQGRAQVRYTLGSRAGAGNHRVEVTSPGIPGSAVFTASAVPKDPAKINLDSGNTQKGLVGQPLPRPFVAVVTDEGHNRLAGVPVTFRVIEGGGSFNGELTHTVETDSDGRALGVPILGTRPGIESNVVEARVASLLGLPAVFSATGLEPGDPSQTRIRGVVLDNSNVPIPGVTLRIRGTALATQSDAQGQFLLAGVPVGNVHLFADGSTAQRPGDWPDLEFELVTVPGAENTLEMPIYLLPLDTAHGLFVDETHGGTLTLPDFPGFSLTVAAGAATFPDGTRHGTITVTAVHADKVPMVPNFGQQPRFIVTIQPPGVRFEPPAQITYPNVDGLPPGAKTELYSFDHDMGSFVATGTATVTTDGSAIRSDPGFGVTKGGWHCGSDPSLAGTVANCEDCRICNGVTCVGDPGQNGAVCANDPCGRCSNGSCIPAVISSVVATANNAHTAVNVPGVPINFHGSVSLVPPACSPVLFEWDFGDGTSSSASSPTHTYSDLRAYTVTLTVRCGQCSREDRIDITLPTMAFTKIWSDQFPIPDTVVANFLPGGAGIEGNRSGYILMAARADGVAYAKATVALSPDTPEIRSRALVRFREYPASAAPSVGFGMLSGNIAAMAVDLGVVDLIPEYEVVAGLDMDGDDQLTPDEVLSDQGPGRFKVVTRLRYIADRTFLAAGAALAVHWQIARAFLRAFVDDTAIAGADLVVPDLACDNDSQPLEHKVGTVFVDSHCGPIRRNLFARTSAVAEAIRGSTALNVALRLTMSEHRQEVRDWAATSSELIGEFGPWRIVTDTSGGTGLQFTDADDELFHTFGAAALDAQVRVTVRRSGSRLELVSHGIDGVLSDLYDWNLDDDIGAPTQSGYVTLGSGGHVFKTTVDVGGQAPGLVFDF